MPVITSIKQQKNKDRVNVYLDDRFGFGIDLDNFVLLHLKVDQELTDEDVAKIVKKAEFQKSLDKLLRFAMVRPRSEREITDYFKRKKVHESLYPELIEKLKHFELLDDEKFAWWWFGQRLEFRPKPRKVVRMELLQKGISREIIDKVLSEMKVDEEKMARGLIEKKLYKWKNLPASKMRQKMSTYLAGKGFGWDVIEKVASSG